MRKMWVRSSENKTVHAKGKTTQYNNKERARDSEEVIKR